MHCVLSLAILSLVGVNALPAVQQYDAEASSTLSANSTSSRMISNTDVYHPLTKRATPAEPKLVTAEPSLFTNVYWAATTSHPPPPPRPSKPAPHISAQPEKNSAHGQDHPENPKDAPRRHTVTSMNIKTSTILVKPIPKPTINSLHHPAPKRPTVTATKVVTSTKFIEPAHEGAHHATPKPSARPKPAPSKAHTTAPPLTIVPIDIPTPT